MQKLIKSKGKDKQRRGCRVPDDRPVVALHKLEEDAGGKGGSYRRTEQICAAGGGKRKHFTTQTLSTRGDNNISSEEKTVRIFFSLSY
jgi:hypothetical protein